MRNVQKARKIVFDLFQQAESQGEAVHRNLLSDHSIVASKIEKVEHSVHHLSHVLDFKFAHLWSEMADVKSKLDTLLLQGAHDGQGAAVTTKLPQVSGASKLPLMPGVSRPPDAMLGALDSGAKERTQSRCKPRGLNAYKTLIVARRLAGGESRGQGIADGVSS